MASVCKALSSSDCISIGQNGVEAFVEAYISVNSWRACLLGHMCLSLHVFVSVLEALILNVYIVLDGSLDFVSVCVSAPL